LGRNYLLSVSSTPLKGKITPASSWGG
jgi:hypothetical protein